MEDQFLISPGHWKYSKMTWFCKKYHMLVYKTALKFHWGIPFQHGQFSLFKFGSWLPFIMAISGINLCMCPANERWCNVVTPSLIGWVHTQNDPWYIVWNTVQWLCNSVNFLPNPHKRHIIGVRQGCHLWSLYCSVFCVILLSAIREQRFLPCNTNGHFEDKSSLNLCEGWSILTHSCQFILKQKLWLWMSDSYWFC